MNTHVRPPLPPELLARFTAIVGERHAITDPLAQEPFLVEGRGLYHGHTSLVLRPGSGSVALAGGALILFPSFYYLFYVFKGHVLGAMKGPAL